jgi:predicted porin
VPLISGFRWDTGVRARWKGGPVEAIGAVTNGTLSNPRVSDDNRGKQLSGRVAITPAIGLVLGVSGADGAWLSRSVAGAAASHQRALGADIEYSRDHWLVRGELVLSRWGLPLPLAPSNVQSVSALGRWVEGRYRITPRIFLAGRVDRLGFSSIHGTAAAALPWDAPVNRIEAGAGYYFQRNLVARATVQSNRRSAGRVTNRTFVSAQLAYWF